MILKLLEVKRLIIIIIPPPGFAAGVPLCSLDGRDPGTDINTIGPVDAN